MSYYDDEPYLVDRHGHWELVDPKAVRMARMHGAVKSPEKFLHEADAKMALKKAKGEKMTVEEVMDMHFKILETPRDEEGPYAIVMGSRGAKDKKHFKSKAEAEKKAKALAKAYMKRHGL